jgi:hypothetical protein
MSMAEHYPVDLLKIDSFISACIGGDAGGGIHQDILAFSSFST